jgi:hypothetical protein
MSNPSYAVHRLHIASFFPVDADSRRGAATEQILPSIWTDHQGCEVCKCVTFVEGGGRDGRSYAWLIDFATDA